MLALVRHKRTYVCPACRGGIREIPASQSRAMARIGPGRNFCAI
jgi:hypothetical protein